MNQVTIIGGGWAGLSAAVHAVNSGFQVRLLEAAPQTGGRARRITHQGLALDNGQHILIGAYRDTLALMRLVGIDTDKHLWRMPLTLRTPDGDGLRLPALPAPLNLLAGIVRARGWTWADKWSLIRRAIQWQQQHFECSPGMSVAELCRGLPSAVMALMIEPLCVSALNLPPAQASAQVFLRVLQDALLGGTGSSDMLIPCVDQSSLLPDAAVQWLKQRGAEVATGHYVEDLSPYLSSPVVLACPSWEAARLTQSINPAWSAQAASLQHTAIATGDHLLCSLCCDATKRYCIEL
ncbi:MAG: NAD(P)-binding protein, partial [Burkholderiales bacterium]|nr:NAD(P)-binding protein [Burkholderiales bacterium]